MVAANSTSQDPRYRAIFETAADPIIVINAGGIIVAFNPAAEKAFGYSVPEVIGQNVNMLMAPPHGVAHDGYLARFLKTGERRIIGIGRETEARRRDGSTFPIDLSVAEWSSGDARYFTGILRDISERRDAEETQQRLAEELERERALLGSVVENLPTGLIIAEAPHGRILVQNAAAGRLLGTRQLRISGSGVDQYANIPAEWSNGRRLAADEHPIVRALQDGAEVDQAEIVYTRPNGQRVTFLCNACPVRDFEGGITHAISTFIDITERRELEAQVTHLARHDPLTGLGNRTLFTERLELAVATARERGASSALVLLDLDGFQGGKRPFRPHGRRRLAPRGCDPDFGLDPAAGHRRPDRR